MNSSPLSSIPPLTWLRNGQVIQNTLVGSVPLTAQGTTGQTADIFDVKNSAGTVLFGVDPSGNLAIAGTASITINDSVTGNLTVGGTSTFTGLATFNGAVQINNSLVATGVTTFGSVTNGGEFKGALQVDGLLNVFGPSFFFGLATFSSGAIFAGGVSFGDGSAAVPSINFSSDTDDGFYHSADLLGFSVLGASVGTWTPTAFTVTQAVGTSGSPTGITFTGGAHTGLTNADLNDTLFNSARTVTFTGGGGAVANLRTNYFKGATYAASAAQTFTNAATVAIETPVVGASVTFTNFVELMLNRTQVGGGTYSMLGFARNGTLYFSIGLNGSDQYSIYASPTNAVFAISSGGNCTITEQISSSGLPTILTLSTAANTGITASTEAVRVNFNLSANQTWAVGSFALQREFLVQAPTYTIAGGASTITTATTFAIDKAPVAGGGTTLTNTYMIRLGTPGTEMANTEVIIGAGAAGRTPLVLQMAASPTVNILSLQTSTGGALAVFNSRGEFVMTPSVATTGSPLAISVTGAAHTTLTNADFTDSLYNYQRVVQFTGAGGGTTITNTYGVRIQPATYGTAGAGALTNTSAYTMKIEGTPQGAVANGGATLTTAYGLAITTRTLTLVTTAYSLYIESMGGASTARSVNINGTGVNNSITWNASTLLFSNAANNLRMMESTNTRGLDFNLTTGQQTIQTTDTTTGVIELQGQTFTPGAAHNAIKIDPTWTAEGFAHTAILLSPTQNGANAVSLTGLNITMNKTSAGSTLATMTALLISSPVSVTTTTLSIAIDIADQSSANITTPRALRTALGVANAFVWGGSPLQYSSGANVIRFQDSTDAGGMSFTLTAAGAQTIASTAGTLTLTSPNIGVATGTSLVTTGNIASTASSILLGVGAVAIPITSNVVTVTGDAGTNTIATMTGGVSGQRVSLIFADALVTVTNNGAAPGANQFDLSGAFTSALHKSLTVVKVAAGYWVEISRSTNT